MFVAAMLMVLPALAQNYGNPYKPASNRSGMPQVEATAPASSFQSTSAMTGSGSSYSANPTLNSDGTASYNGASTSGPRHAKKDGEGEGGGGGGIGAIDPEEYEEKPLETPLGDAVLPLMLMSLAFCGVIYLRRRKTVKG